MSLFDCGTVPENVGCEAVIKTHNKLKVRLILLNVLIFPVFLYRSFLTTPGTSEGAQWDQQCFSSKKSYEICLYQLIEDKGDICEEDIIQWKICEKCWKVYYWYLLF